MAVWQPPPCSHYSTLSCPGLWGRSLSPHQIMDGLANKYNHRPSASNRHWQAYGSSSERCRPHRRSRLAVIAIMSTGDLRMWCPCNDENSKVDGIIDVFFFFFNIVGINRIGNRTEGKGKERRRNVVLLVACATLQITQGEWHLQCTAWVQCSCGIYLFILFLQISILG